MHYKNGRPANEGDSVIAPVYRGGTLKPTAGVIHSIAPGSQSCNAQVNTITPGRVESTCVTVGDCYHAEDAFNAIDSKPEPAKDTQETAG